MAAAAEVDHRRLLPQRRAVQAGRRRRHRTHGVGPCQGRSRAEPPIGVLLLMLLLVLAVSAGRSRGQGGAPCWTNDLEAGEDRRRIRRREGPDDLRSWLTCTHSGPRTWGSA